jgi:hypothetical protein
MWSHFMGQDMGTQWTYSDILKENLLEKGCLRGQEWDGLWRVRLPCVLTPHSSDRARRFGRKCDLHLQLGACFCWFLACLTFRFPVWRLCSSETSGCLRSTRRYNADELWTCCVHQFRSIFTTLKVEARGLSEIFVTTYQATWCHISKDTNKQREPEVSLFRAAST